MTEFRGTKHLSHINVSVYEETCKSILRVYTVRNFSKSMLTPSLDTKQEQSSKGDALLNVSQAIDALLIDGEEVIQRGGVAPQFLSYTKWLYLGVNTFLVIITLGVWLVFVPFFIVHWLKLKRQKWYITDRRLISVSGLIGLQTQEISYQRFAEATLKQGMLSRLFDTGTIMVSDTGTNRIELKLINKPLEIKKLLSQRAATL